ncbi:MAG TPA: hypothetical protein VIL00_12960 [Pseudonocardiaceae bacterium]
MTTPQNRIDLPYKLKVTAGVITVIALVALLITSLVREQGALYPLILAGFAALIALGLGGSLWRRAHHH